MAFEIERKFLPANENWRGLAPGAVYMQGYLCAESGRAVRVRLAGGQGFLTIKGPARGLKRQEFEYAIAPDDARALLALCPLPLIEKTRYCIPYAGFVWEVDEFAGDNAGLVVIEVELSSEAEDPPKPEWVGREVSTDPRYTNAMLCRHPYTTWKKR